jgi:putative chitinase
MKVTEILNEIWTEKKPVVPAQQGVGSGIVVDKNYKDVPAAPVAKPKAPAPVAQPAAPVAKPVAKPVAAEPAPFDPAAHKNTLISIAKKMGITAVNDLSNLLGQAQVETASWTKSAESFNYTDPTRIYKVFTSNFPTPQQAAPYVGNQVALANRALANKNGNGDEASGDGWKFRGRGFLHITGRELYAKAGAAVHPENPGIYVANPTLLSSNPVEAAKAAVWYFNTKVGKGKTSKQASKVVNPAGLKTKERAKASAQMQAQLAPVKKTRKT